MPMEQDLQGTARDRGGWGEVAGSGEGNPEVANSFRRSGDLGDPSPCPLDQVLCLRLSLAPGQSTARQTSEILNRFANFPDS